MSGVDISTGDMLTEYVKAAAARTPQEIARERRAKNGSEDSGKMAPAPAEEAPPLPPPDHPPEEDDVDVGTEVRIGVKRFASSYVRMFIPSYTAILYIYIWLVDSLYKCI